MKATILSLLSLILFGFSSIPLKVFKTDSAASFMKIEGTSTLHDWEMEAENLNGSMDINLYEDKVEIEELNLIVESKSLKSGKRAMDANAYKALKADDFPKITYNFIETLKYEKLNENELKLLTKGKLSIAGKSKMVTIPVKARIGTDNIKLSGSVHLTMTEFSIEPPSFMMGTVTTGDKITIHFSINYN